MHSTATASWLALRGAGGRQARPAPWVDRKCESSGKDSLGWRRRCPNPAEPRRNRQLVSTIQTSP